jgi:polar amino acid transport system substrate-binding protein
MTRRLHCLLSLFVLLFAALAQAQTEAPAVAEQRSFQQVLAATKLRVGVNLLMPNAMRDKSGELIGAEIDIAERLAKDIGVEAEYRLYPWEQLIPALQRGEVDLLIAGIAITPERALQVWFSNPYGKSGIGIATNTGLTKGFDDLTDLNNAQVAIGVMAGTVSEQVARELFKEASIKRFDDERQLEEAVVKGLLHAYVRSEPAPRLLALRHPQTVDVPINKPLLATREAFAVRRGDADFINFLNAWVAAREADGWLPSTQRYWFESLGWQDRVAPAQAAQ